jgi:hypothetical protein
MVVVTAELDELRPGDRRRVVPAFADRLEARLRLAASDRICGT